MRFVLIFASSVLIAFAVQSEQSAYAQTNVSEKLPKPAETERPQGSLGTPSDDALKAAEEAEATESGVNAPPAGGTTKRQVVSKQKPEKIVRKRRPTSIRIKQVEFTPSGYLDADDLHQISDGFVGTRLKLSSLGVITSAVDKLYAEKNIGLAQAILQNVNISAGLVNVELFEARIGSINFQSKNATAKYLAWRLGLETGDLADTRIINERLVKIALTDGLLAEADFQPGQKRGTTNLNIKIQEPGLIGGFISTDNYGKKNTGEHQASFSLVNRSLTGRNDPIEIGGTLSESSWSTYGNYSSIITPGGTRLSLSGSAGYSKTLTAPEVTSATRQGELTLQIPLLLKIDKRLFVQMSGAIFRETGEIVGTQFVDQRGYIVSAGLSGYWSKGNLTFSASQSVRYASWSDGITLESDIEHVALFGNTEAYLRLNRSYAVSVQAGWQATLTGRSPALYGQTIASQTAVRGYLDSGSKGDSGIYARSQLERITPLVLSKTAPSPQQLGAALYPYIFGDVGRAFDYTPAGHIAQDAIASTGVGVTVDFGKSIQASAYIAKPLLDANGVTAKGQYAFKFSLTKSF